jgi:hypothetical protein
VLGTGSTLLLVPSYAQIGTINKLSKLSPKPASINLWKWFLSPTGSIKPWFHTEGNLPLCSSYLPLGVPNWVASTAYHGLATCCAALMYSHRVGLEYNICHADKQILLLVYMPQPTPLETQETHFRSPCYSVTVDAIKASSGNSD